MKSLRVKLAIGFGGLLVILFAISILSVVVLTRYSHALEKVFRENYDSAVYCNAMKEALDELNGRAQRLVWHEADDTDQRSQTVRFDTNLHRQMGNCSLPGEALLKQFLQAGCRLVLAAQNKELRVATKPCTQSGRLTADLAVALRAAALEPQVRLAIELILQVMSERLSR